MDDELRFHFEQEVNKYEKSGVPHEEALRRARLAFGGMELAKEECREARGISFLETTIQDFRHGLRLLRHRPGFAAVAVLTLALGIAANTTIFSAVSAILLRKPPVQDPDILCAVTCKNLHDDLLWVSAPDFLSWRKQNGVFEDLAAVASARPFTLTGAGEPESVRGDLVTPEYFHVAGIAPVLGRAFLSSEGQAGKNHVVMLSDALWRERFASDPHVIGKDLRINGEPYKIIGVMPPRAAQITTSRPQLWMPLVFSPNDLTPSARGNHYINLVLGRLKPSVTVKQAQAAMNSIAQRLAQSYPKTNKDWGITVLTLHEYNIRSRDVRNGMVVLMTAVGLVLLIACANIAGLLLARGTERGHELAVRLAVGASRVRLLRQMLAENLLIGIGGGAAGLLLSIWGIQLLRAGFDFNEYGRELAAGFRMDQHTLLFAIVVSLLTTIVFGLAPAIRASRASPRDALSESGRTGASFNRSRLRSVFVVGEIALALVLVTAACLVAQQIVRELSEPNGFNARNIVIANLDVSSRYKELDARVALFKQVTDTLRNLPDVGDAAVDSCVPMGCFYSLPFDIMGRAPLSPSQRPSADFFVVGPNYFRTMQIPLLEGRHFSVHDNVDAPIAAIVNQEFARRFFPKESAIGKQIEVKDGNHKQAQIVGIVGNVNTYMGEISPHAQIYECYLQIPVDAFSTMALIVRSRVAPATLATSLRRAVWWVDKDQPVGRIHTMQELLADNVGGDKLVAGLMGIFAALALVLAAIGIYGVIAYSVSQRTHEIGIRAALGAQKKDVLSLVLRQGGVLTAIGCAIGILLALPLPRLLSGLFNAFTVQGPLVSIAVAFIVAVVSLLATYIPAHRAAKVDPAVALRYE